ncbi:MAG: hypothetical protein JXA71_03825 [Chitinispirillaceae bacterium]|nr:hypothetical protein [Chitinispirillaceae bacterium]
MVKKMLRRSAIAVGAALLALCGGRVPAEDVVAVVGSARITRQDVETFRAVALLATAVPDTAGLLTMDELKGLVYTETIYRKACRNPAAAAAQFGREWRWKRRFYLSRMFETDILQKNCGYSDEELRDFYRKYRDAFAVEDGTVPPFDSISFAVARKMFQVNYRHAGGVDYSQPGNFRYFITDAYPEYFTRKYYKQEYGDTLHGDLKEISRKTGIFSDRDLRAALKILAPSELTEYDKDPVPFYQSLVRWKLFSEKAASTGYASRRKVKRTLRMAWKVECAQRYVNDVFLPVIKRDLSLDTAMTLLSYFDETGTVPVAVHDSNVLRSHFGRSIIQKMMARFDSLVYPACHAAGVKLLQEGWKDVIGGDPAALRRRADSLRDAGSGIEALNYYSILASNYGFSEEGKEAVLEQAALLSEKRESVPEAIRLYRGYLLHADETEKRSETMFKIALLYDRELGRNDMAEINYRWILKNAPQSLQARDAEVMLLHLGEPMPGGEELRVEAARQNR